MRGLRVIAAVGGIQVVGIVVTIGRSKATALLLGPEGVGVVSVVEQVVNLLVQLCTFSLPLVAVKFLSRSHSRGAGPFQRSYAGLLQALLGVTVVGAVIAMGTLLLRPGLFGEELVPYRWLLAVGIVAIPLVGLQGFFRNVVAASGEARTSAVLDVSVASVTAAGVVAGVLWAGEFGYFTGQLVVGVGVVAVVAVWLRRRYGLRAFAQGLRIRDELRASPDLLRFAAVMYVIAFVQPLALLVARYTVLDGYGEAMTGLLQAAIALGLALNMVLNPANGLYLTPILNRDLPVAEKLAETLHFQRQLMVAVGVLAMPLVLLPEAVLLVLYSSEFVAVAPVVFLFVVAQALLQIAGVYQALAIGLDDIKVYGLVMLLTQAILAVGCWALVPRLGVAGVGAAMILSSTALSLLLLARLHRTHGLAFPPRLGGSVVYVVAALGAAGWAFGPMELWSVPVLATKALVYVAFVGSLLWLFLDAPERMALWARVRATVGGRAAR